jgi:branched-chain amino acid transport system permease protein
MAELLATIWSGVVLGSMYALMAVGLALVWGGLRVLNLAQGALFVLGAYAAVLVADAGLPPIAGVAAGGILMAGLGVGMYFLPLKSLAFREDRDWATLLATFALGITLQEVARLTFGPRIKSVPDLVDGRFDLGGVVFTWNEVTMVMTALALMAGLALLLRKTRLGFAVRATAANRDGAQLSGVGIHSTSALILAISSGLAGVGGVLLASSFFVSPYLGVNYLVIALIVVILGGLGSIVGALGAAYIVGLVQQVAALYLGTRWSLPLLFTLIIVMLTVRPGGLAGRVSTERI